MKTYRGQASSGIWFNLWRYAFFRGTWNALISANLSFLPSSHFLLPRSSIIMVTTRTQAALQDSSNQSQVLVKEDGKKRARVEGERLRLSVPTPQADQGRNMISVRWGFRRAGWTRFWPRQRCEFQHLLSDLKSLMQSSTLLPPCSISSSFLSHPCTSPTLNSAYSLVSHDPLSISHDELSIKESLSGSSWTKLEKDSIRQYSSTTIVKLYSPSSFALQHSNHSSKLSGSNSNVGNGGCIRGTWGNTSIDTMTFQRMED